MGYGSEVRKFSETTKGPKVHEGAESQAWLMKCLAWMLV